MDFIGLHVKQWWCSPGGRGAGAVHQVGDRRSAPMAPTRISIFVSVHMKGYCLLVAHDRGSVSYPPAIIDAGGRCRHINGD
jgi:hypothetical protein